jgi:hypothetical protein
MAITRRQIARIHILLKEAGVAQSKADILAGFGVKSTSDLTADQYQTLVETLIDLAKKKSPQTEAIRKKRSAILRLCSEMMVWDGLDWGRLNAYISQPRLAGKLLYECNFDELVDLYKKLKVIQSKSLAQKEAQNNIAKWN